MSGEIPLEHVGEYGKTFVLAQKGAAFFGIVFLLTLLLRNVLFSDWFIAGSIFAGVMLIGDLVVLIVYGAKLKTVGEFEKIDIIENHITYISQAQGQAIFQPRNILKISIVKKPRGAVTELTIYFYNSTEVFHTPKTVSKYVELVRKIEVFANENFIPWEETVEK